MKLKKLLKNITPPVLWTGMQKLCSKGKPTGLQWIGDYASFQDAARASSGYNEQAITPHVLEAARKVRDGEALWERDSVCFYHEEYNTHLMAALFQVAAHTKGALHVLDFGGALGSTYMQHRKLLHTLPEITWHVVEQEHLISLGKKEFSTETLHFHTTIEEAYSQAPINCVVLSSVLQYIPDPHELLKSIKKFSPYSIYVGRTPVHTKKDTITVQYVSENIYKASYPCWFFNEEQVLNDFQYDFEMFPWEQSRIDPKGFKNIFLWKKNRIYDEF